MQEVTVAPLITQPRSQTPAHREQEREAHRERDEHEAAREVDLEGECGDSGAGEDGGGNRHHPLELLRAHPEDAGVVGAAQDHGEHPCQCDDQGDRQVRRIVEFDRVRNRPAQHEASKAGDQDRDDVEDDRTRHVHLERVAPQVRAVTVGVGLGPADAAGHAQGDRVLKVYALSLRLLLVQRHLSPRERG